MKTYIKPSIVLVPADANILADSKTLGIYNYDKFDIGDIDDYTITDGSQILIPRNHLWDEEEE